MSKILLTGGTGFFGSHIKEELESLGHSVYTFGRKKYSLLDYEATRAAFVDSRPDYVIHAAAIQGGIGFNRTNPVNLLSDNIRMSLNLFDACVEFKPKKLLSIISSCAYPNLSDIIGEDALWNGRAHDSIAAHAYAKKLLQEASIAYNKQYGLNAVTVAVTNLYGPRANFHTENSKVVEATIRKLSSDNDVEFWGRGVEKRQLMYVKDAAFCVVKALDLYQDNTKPLNIGCSYEVTIKELVNQVKKLTEFSHKVTWDKTKPDGQLRKMLDISSMQKLFLDNNIEFNETTLEDGLKATIEWYQQNRHTIK